MTERTDGVLVYSKEHEIDASSSAPAATESLPDERQYTDNGEAKATPDPVHTVDLDRVEEQLQQHKLRMLASEEWGDPNDYQNERRDQEAFKRGDPDYNSPRRQQERLERNQRLLDQYREEAEAAAQNEPTEIEAKIEQARAQAKAHVRIEQYEKENPGFVEFVQATMETYGDLTFEAASAIHESPYGPAIIDRLFRVPELIEQVNQLPPREMDRFVARMEGMLDMGLPSTPRAPEPELPKPNRISKAPKPVTTVSGSHHSASKAPQDMDYDEYKAWRNAQEAKKRGWGRMS